MAITAIQSEDAGTCNGAAGSAWLADDKTGILTQIGTLTARPTAFLIVAAYAAAWLIFSPETLTWHSIATLATWLTTLFIQRAEHRDTQAIQAKLDELIRAQVGAREEVITIEDHEPEDIKRIREHGRERNRA